MLVKVYASDVTSKLVFSGPFSPGGRALAESAGAKIVNDD